MRLDEQILKLKELLTDPPLLMEQLMTLLLPSSSLFDETLLASNRYKKTQKEQDGRLISDDQAAIEFAKIDKSLLGIINEITAKDLKNSPGQQLNHSHIYLCDRVPQNDTFIKTSMDQPQERSRFFFMLGHEYEQHISLFKRFAMEMKAGGSRVIEAEMMLPQSSLEEVFRREFISEFFQKFEIKVNQEEPLEEKNLAWLCDNSAPVQGLSKEDYVCVYIEMDELDWDATTTPERTSWFVHNVCKCDLPENSPTFLFFFAIRYSEDDSYVEDEAKQAIQASTHVIGLPELQKVTWKDAALWFRRFSFINPDPKALNELRDSTFDRNQTYHMSDVEVELRRIIDKFNGQHF